MTNLLYILLPISSPTTLLQATAAARRHKDSLRTYRYCPTEHLACLLCVRVNGLYKPLAMQPESSRAFLAVTVSSSLVTRAVTGWTHAHNWPT